MSTAPRGRRATGAENWSDVDHALAYLGLVDVETHLGWLREMGFADADCLWRWREMALLAAVRPVTDGHPRATPA